MLSIEGGTTRVSSANIAGPVYVAGILRMDDSSVSGVLENESAVAIGASGQAEISGSAITGSDNVELIWNRGKLRLEDSELSLDFASTGVRNFGEATLSRVTIRTLGGNTNSVMSIENDGVMEVIASLIEGGIVNDDPAAEILNSAGRLQISNSVIKDVNIRSEAGTVSCVLVSDGRGSQLGRECQTGQ
jgi:hypothetical protein